jgi:hypothetical protein
MGKQFVRSKALDFDEVRNIAMALPDVEESTIHGAPSLKRHARRISQFVASVSSTGRDLV